jgi:hypothetical protein
MKKLKMISRIMMMGMLVFGLVTIVLSFSQSVFADCGGVQTSIINCNETDAKSGIFAILGMVLNILTFGVGIAATAGFIFCGYQYMTSKNEPAVIAKIKTRILNIVIGLLAYAMFWAIIALLLPGGLN